MAGRKSKRANDSGTRQEKTHLDGTRAGEGRGTYGGQGSVEKVGTVAEKVGVSGIHSKIRTISDLAASKETWRPDPYTQTGEEGEKNFANSRTPKRAVTIQHQREGLGRSKRSRASGEKSVR